jgi:hypothetical protein
MTTDGHDDRVLNEWKNATYEDAMRIANDCLRESDERRSPERDHFPGAGASDEAVLLRQQRDALQAAAWFAFARELRESGLSKPTRAPTRVQSV